MRFEHWRLLLALACLTFSAGVLRFWGLSFGLPLMMARPDEEAVIAVAGRILRYGGSPGFFDYPTLFIYAVALAEKAWVGRVEIGDPSLFLVSRVLTALVGTLSVPLLFASARRLFSTGPAFVAAALLAVAFLHVRDSHFGVTDVPATFMIVLAFFFIVSRPLDRAHWRNVVLTALLCGLAASTKYNALLIAAPLVVAVAQQKGGPFVYALVALGVIGGFLAGTPYAALARAKFIADVIGVWSHLASGHAVEQGVGWTHHLTFSLRYGLGWPFLIAALGGAAALVIEDLRVAGLVLAFPLLYYLLIGSGQTVFMRYMTPLVPFAALLAAFAVDRTARLVARTGGGSARHALRVCTLVGLAVFVGYDSVARAIALDRLLSVTDSRVLAAEWVRARHPGGISVHQTGSGYARVQLDPEGAFPDVTFDAMRGTFVYLGRPAVGPRLVIVLTSRLTAYTPVPQSLWGVLARDYRLAQKFDVEEAASSARPVFDEQDAFFVPVTGFERFIRPGPAVEIYQLQR